MAKKLFLGFFIFIISSYASKGHILACNPSSGCQIIIHYTAPTGTNDSESTWVSILATLQSNGSIFLPIGNGTAEITNNENNSLIGGSFREISFITNGCGHDPSSACLLEVVDKAIVQDEIRFKAKYRFFGQLIE